MPTTHQTCPCCYETFVATSLRRDGQTSCPSCGRIFPVQAAPAPPLWYYTHDRQKYGPLTLMELRRLAAAGLLRRTDMVLQDGTSKWIAADTVPSLFADVTTPGQQPSPHAFRPVAQPEPRPHGPAPGSS